MIEEFEKQIENQIELIKWASPIIRQVKEQNKGRDFQGIETCPKCGNDIFYKHSKINGHVWMKCKTENCINFME